MGPISNMPYSNLTATPGGLIGSQPGMPAPDRLTLQQQANALIFDLDRANNILDQMSMAPTNGGVNNPELSLSLALETARERLGQHIDRLSSLAMHVGQI